MPFNQPILGFLGLVLEGICLGISWINPPRKGRFNHPHRVIHGCWGSKLFQVSPVATWLEMRFLRCSEPLTLSARGTWVPHQGDGSESGEWETAAFSLLNFPLSTLGCLCRCVPSCEMDLNAPHAVKDAGLDQRGQWGRAKALSGPCPFLPVSPQRPLPPLLLLAMAADLFASRVRSPGSLSPEKSVFPKCI